MERPTLFFTICFSWLTSVVLFGQVYVDGVAVDTLNTPYCQLICSNPTVMTRTSVIIDYGQRFVSTGFNRQKIAGPDKKVINFNSTIDALNFMVRQGWELVSCQVLGEKSASDGSFIYLLRRRRNTQLTN